MREFSPLGGGHQSPASEPASSRDNTLTIRHRGHRNLSGRVREPTLTSGIRAVSVPRWLPSRWKQVRPRFERAVRRVQLLAAHIAGRLRCPARSLGTLVPPRRGATRVPGRACFSCWSPFARATRAPRKVRPAQAKKVQPDAYSLDKFYAWLQDS